MRKIAEDEMTARLQDAHYSRRSAIADAHAASKVLEIEERQLDHFVDCHIQDAAKRLRKTLEGE